MRRIFCSVICVLIGGVFWGGGVWAQTPQKKITKSQSGAKKATKKGSTLSQRHASDLAHLKLMRTEMNRYLKFFKKRPEPKVYYLRYRLRTHRQLSVSAADGIVLAQKDNRKNPSRQIDVQLRVGNPKFDQTGRDGYDWKIYRSLLPASSFCPTECNPSILKKMFWQNTDRDYRVAFGQYWRKRYVRSLKPKILDKAGDFSKESATIYLAPLDPAFSFKLKKWKGIVRRVSALTKHSKSIVNSQVSVTGWEEVILGVASDGSKVRFRKFGYNWSMSLAYLSGKSKEYIGATDSGYAKTEAGLPNEKELTRKFHKLWKDAKERVESEEGEPDEGPAIVDPYIAGAMFYDILMVQLETGRFLRKSSQRVFAKKMGQQIIPSFLSIVDDPTLTHWKKTPLSAHYLYDDQWVRSKRMTMIEDGILKRFYISRKPYKKYKRSNGHGRAAFGRAGFSRPGTAIVQSGRAFPLSVLRQKLLDEMKRQGKRYGYILSRFNGYSQVYSGTYSLKPAVLLRLDATTGKLTRLKKMQVNMPALQVLSGILATGDDYTVFNGSDSDNSGSISISTVSPSLLLKRLVFRRFQLSEKKDFKLSPPFTPLTLDQIEKKQQKAKASQSALCPSVDICRRCAACNKSKK